MPFRYHPKDSRKQYIQVAITGTSRREELVPNDISIKATKAAIRTTADLRLGYAQTVPSRETITIRDTQKVWIIDDYL